MKYLFSPRTEAIDMNELEKDLQGLNSLFEKMTWTQTSIHTTDRNMGNAIKKSVTAKKGGKPVFLSKWLHKGKVNLKMIHQKGIYSNSLKYSK
jgi:hypothetical protein